MKDNSIPLLSIIIPTKNRQYTCLFAIESVLRLKEKDIEIIIQDCSDSDILKDQIVKKFGLDSRLKYEHTYSNPSMTENWNRAFERSCGIYKCGIGDDDAVLDNIYEVAKWAYENQIEAVGHSKNCLYFWPDFTSKIEYQSNLLIKSEPFSNTIRILDKEELNQIIKTMATIPSMVYTKLPMVYHCLLSNTLIDKLVAKTGKLLDSTSLDVYSSICLASIVDRYYVYKNPFTLPGACGSSNSNSASLKKIARHFREFKTIERDSRIPDSFNLTFTLAQSTQIAFLNIKDHKNQKLLNLPNLYADFLSYSLSPNLISQIFSLTKRFSFTKKDYINLFKLYFKYLFEKRINKFKNLIKYFLFRSSYLRSVILKNKQKNNCYVKSSNIIEAIEILKKVIK